MTKEKDTLKLSEERYRCLVESSGIGIATIDTRGKLSYINDAACRLIGCSKDELIGKTFTRFLHSDDKKKMMKLFLRTSAYPKENLGLEFRLIHKNGNIVYCIFTLTIFKFRGQLQGFNAVIYDITEKKREENALNEIEKRYNALFNSKICLVYLHDFKGNFIDANPSLLKKLAYTKKELMPLNFFSLLDSDQRKQEFKSLQEIKKYGYQKEPKKYRLRTKKGSIIEVETFGAIVYRDGKPFAIQRIAYDITEQQKSEGLIRREQDKVQQILDIAAVILVAIDKKGIVTNINKKGCEILGYEEHDIIGKNWFHNFIPRHIKKNIQYVSKKIISGENKSTGYFENPVITKSGEERLIAWHNTPIRDNLGNIIGHLSSGEDITVKRKTENDLINAIQQWQKTFDSIGDPISVFDKNYKILQCNKAMIELLKKPSSEIIGRACWEIFHGTSSPIDGCPMVRIQQSKHRESLILPYNDKWFDVQVDPIVDTNENIIACIQIMKDINKRKEAEIALKKNEERLKQAQQIAKLGNWEWDIKNNELWWSDELYDIFGVEKNKFELIYENIVNLIHPDYREKNQKMVDTLLKHKTAEPTELKIVNPNGKIKWIRQIIEVTKSESNSLPLIKGTIHDISDIKKSQEKLQESEKKYREFANSLPQIVYETDAHGNLTFVNEASFFITGYTKEDFERGLNVIQMVSPNDQERAKSNIKKIMRGETMVNSEYLLQKKDGTTFPASFHSAPIRKGNKILGFRGFSIDITERKKVEEKLRNYQHEIEKQNIQLKKLDKIKTDFLNVTSHELRTPMSAIKGYIQMILKQKLGQITKEQRHALTVVLKNTNRLDSLISDILDISRLESGTMKFVVEKTDIKEMICDAIETMQMTAALKNIKITSEIEQGLPKIIIDRERIKQVITNIVNNAIKFSSNGSLINVRAKKGEEQIVFEIQDYGRGIPKDKQEKIFDIFYQVDSGIDRKFDGAGLGLSVAKGIIISHGGKIWVESTGMPGEGSVFRFTLPLISVQDLEIKFRDADIFKLRETTYL